MEQKVQETQEEELKVREGIQSENEAKLVQLKADFDAKKTLELADQAKSLQDTFNEEKKRLLLER